MIRALMDELDEQIGVAGDGLERRDLGILQTGDELLLESFVVLANHLVSAGLTGVLPCAGKNLARVFIGHRDDPPYFHWL